VFPARNSMWSYFGRNFRLEIRSRTGNVAWGGFSDLGRCTSIWRNGCTSTRLLLVMPMPRKPSSDMVVLLCLRQSFNFNWNVKHNALFATQVVQRVDAMAMVKSVGTRTSLERCCHYKGNVNQPQGWGDCAVRETMLNFKCTDRKILSQDPECRKCHVKPGSNRRERIAYPDTFGSPLLTQRNTALSIGRECETVV